MPRCLGCSMMTRCGRGPAPGAGGPSRLKGQPQGGGVARGAAGPRVTVLREVVPRDTRRVSPSPGPDGATSRPKPFSLMYSSMISARETKPVIKRKGLMAPRSVPFPPLPIHSFLWAECRAIKPKYTKAPAVLANNLPAIPNVPIPSS